MTENLRLDFRPATGGKSRPRPGLELQEAKVEAHGKPKDLIGSKTVNK
jgi:hypothetical protein